MLEIGDSLIGSHMLRGQQCHLGAESMATSEVVIRPLVPRDPFFCVFAGP